MCPHVGTSGWSYNHWVPSFYPPELPRSEWLGHYVSHFDTVELNSSFYRLPFEGMVTGWNRRLPEGFHFVAKGPRRITHVQRLAGVEANLERFLARIEGVRALRVLLWQLPPSFRFDPERLEQFLALLPARMRHAFEFRHESWWREETKALLSRFGAAFASISHPRLPNDVVATSDFLYLRFHGTGRRLYDHDYSDSELLEWKARIEPHLPGRNLYAFFNNDVRAIAPRNAARFRELLMA